MKQRKVGASVEQYRQLVAMMAWKAWRKLPAQTRVWIGIDDMIEDGMMAAVVLMKSYNPNWASFTTALYHRLHKFYINNYLELLSAQQRGWTKVNGKLAPIPHRSLEGMRLINKEEKAMDDIVGFIPALIVDTKDIEQNLLMHCCVIPALEEIYQASSPKCQDAFVQWFLTRKETRIHKKNPKFKRVAREFRDLCRQREVTCDDCLHVIRSPQCLDVLSRDILHVPYDLDRPCPQVERIL